MARHRGVVKFFNEKRGSGLISTAEKDYAVHYDDIELPGYATLEDGEIVDFDASDDADKAQNVTPRRATS